ncbi:MAG TPA: Sec-independent protein translocase protein TatB [Acidimicrobiales bacterium]|nr:Sec-independent protein translocase protein TatB [Acidimicrobiales bacterium]
MFNVTGGELVIILLVALIVLGPDKLPDAIRKVGRVYGELRRMSAGFQSELRDALDEPLREVRDTVDTVKSGFTFGDDGEPMPTATPSEGPRLPPDDGAAAAAAAEPEPDAVETSDASAADAVATPPANGTAPATGSNGTNGGPAVPPIVTPAPAGDEPVAPAETD